MSMAEQHIRKPEAANSGYTEVAQNKISESGKETDDGTCSFLVQQIDIQLMKQDLQGLLSSFRAEKLKAIGKDDAILQMDYVRSKQGKLARLHFGLDSQVNYCENLGSPENHQQRLQNMSTLLESMENLSSAIKSLNSSNRSYSKSPQN